MKDLLKDILDSWNIWHAKQKRAVDKTNSSLSGVRITKRDKVERLSNEREKGKA